MTKAFLAITTGILSLGLDGTIAEQMTIPTQKSPSPYGSIASIDVFPVVNSSLAPSMFPR
jgi:hypothetical protein